MRLLPLLLAIPCFAQPHWTSIATPRDAFQYFLYAGARHIEDAQFSAANPHPSPQFNYRFVSGSAVRTVCKLEDRPGVYWYSPDGRHLAGTFPVSSPTEFNVSAQQTGIRGFGVTGAFSGSAPRPGAVEIVYFTDRACSDAGVEFGFSRDLSTRSILVYWATYANCGNDSSSLCRKTNSGALGSNIQQENAGPRADHGFRLYGLDPEAVYTYKLSIESHKLHVEVWNGRKLAECAGSEESSRVPCSLYRSVQPWFPIDQIKAGYIVAGTQNTAGSGAPENAVFKVSDILVYK